MTTQGPQFFGKFRAKVTDNRDPLTLGRVRVKAPDVYGENESGWAMPALPYTGKDVGLFLIPPVNASVWVEFEHGDPDYPIWAGGFWAQGELPASPATAEMKVLKTDNATITINDLPGAGGITIETKAGMKIKIDTTGIEINNGTGGSVKLSGPQVSVNSGAFEVT